MVKKLAEVTLINAKTERSVKNGYAVAVPEGMFAFGTERFKLDDRCYVESIPNKQDMARIVGEIENAKKQADVVLISVHSHECDGEETNVPAQFLETFSRNCIDTGADVIIGHGPHELQGVERYGDGLILYSIGNFIFQTDTVSLQPWDAYVNRNLPVTMKVGEYMDERSANGTKGYCVQWPIWNAVLPSWDMEDGRITRVRFYPIDLGMEKVRSRKGVPVLNGSEETLRYLQTLCAPFGTQIRIENGVGYLEL